MARQPEQVSFGTEKPSGKHCMRQRSMGVGLGVGEDVLILSHCTKAIKQMRIATHASQNRSSPDLFRNVSISYIRYNPPLFSEQLYEQD